MAGLNTSMLAIVAALVLGGVGWAAIHLARAGFDYIHEGNNPRGKAMAHESLWAVGKGAALIAGAAGIAAFAFSTIHFA
jgi:hypothetical protein